MHAEYIRVKEYFMLEYISNNSHLPVCPPPLAYLVLELYLSFSDLAFSSKPHVLTMQLLELIFSLCILSRLASGISINVSISYCISFFVLRAKWC